MQIIGDVKWSKVQQNNSIINVMHLGSVSERAEQAGMKYPDRRPFPTSILL